MQHLKSQGVWNEQPRWIWESTEKTFSLVDLFEGRGILDYKASKEHCGFQEPNLLNTYYFIRGKVKKSTFNIQWFIWAKSTFKTRNPKYSKKKLHHEYIIRPLKRRATIPTCILSTAPHAESSLLYGRNLLLASPHFSHPHLCTSQEELSEQEYFLLPHNLSHSVILEPTFSQKFIADFISPVKTIQTKCTFLVRNKLSY